MKSAGRRLSWKPSRESSSHPTPEAAEAMSKLVDLYHRDGRLFGLVRHGPAVHCLQPTHPNHKAVMLKLIDGQEGTLAQQGPATTIRQFLARYPDAPNVRRSKFDWPTCCNSLTIESGGRSLSVPSGGVSPTRMGGVTARRQCNSSARRILPSRLLRPAQLGEEMLDKLPAGEFAREIGLPGVSRLSPAGAVGQEHGRGDENIPEGSCRRSRVAAPAPSVHCQRITPTCATRQCRTESAAGAGHPRRPVGALPPIFRLYHAAAKPPELEPLVTQYVQKYPQRPDRFHGVSYLALSCIANGEKPRASLMSTLLVDDPITNSNAQIFVRENRSRGGEYPAPSKNCCRRSPRTLPALPICGMPWRLTLSRPHEGSAQANRRCAS